jgi:hypothetical protein
MNKAQIVAHARTMVHEYVAGTATAGKPLDTTFDRLSVITYLVAMPPIDVWVLGGLVTIQQLERWMIEALSQTQTLSITSPNSREQFFTIH